jgi:hypothetical protein
MRDGIKIADYCFDESEIAIKPVTIKLSSKKHFMCMPESWAIRVFEVARQKQSPGPVIVGLILWQKHRMQRGRQPLKFTNPMLERFGLGRKFFKKWLQVLEEHDLISTQKFRYRSPLITLIEVGEDKE